MLRKNKKNIKFQKLTPVSDVKLGVYENALDFVFRNKDILNIAITGGYSAGKSSIIRSYQNKHHSKKFIYISLGVYGDEKNKLTRGEEHSSIENVIEGKILNQLIHQIPDRKIPQTHFSKKSKFRKGMAIFKCVLAFLFVVCSYIFFSFSDWTGLVCTLPYEKLVSFLTSWYIHIGSGFLFLFIAGFFLYELIKLQKNKSILKHVKIQGNEIDIFPENDDSFFDKYLNEVIYLFQKSGADAVVFEDMDRFDSVALFSRLREINKLANEGACRPSDTIRFFYLLRDNMFSADNRTKFFDFILPVVPIVNTSNSYGAFSTLIQEGKTDNNLDSGFLKDVSLYIDDMRIIKNICNEFVIYDKRLSFSEPNDEKLLSLIIYKNLFPSDFSRLQLNEGFLFDLMNYLPGSDDGELRNLKKQLYRAKKKKESISTINDIYRNIDSISNRKLSELILNGDIDQIFSTVGKSKSYYADIMNSRYLDLVKYLTRNEYLDESYIDYISYLDPLSMTRNDLVYVHSVKDHRFKNFDYRLDSPEKVTSSLRNKDYEQKEILNFDLIHYVVETPTCRNQINCVINQIVDNKYYDFIYEYILDKWPGTELLLKVLTIRPEFLQKALQDEKLELKKKRKILEVSIYVFCKLSDSCITNIKNSGAVDKFIDNDPEFLKIDSPDVVEFIRGIKRYQYLFKSVKLEAVNPVVWNALYIDDLYQLNMRMISDILLFSYGVTNDPDKISSNILTHIIKFSNSPLFHYVSSMLCEFLDALDIKYDEFTDDYTVVIKLLNNLKIDIERKKRYLKKVSTPIESLDDVTDVSLDSYILSYRKLKPTALNIIALFKRHNDSFDSYSIAFINENSFDLSGLDSVLSLHGFSFDDIYKFADVIARSSTIVCETYRFLLISIGIKIRKIQYSYCDSAHMKILIDSNLVEMNYENLQVLRNYYAENVIQFIKNDVSSYVAMDHAASSEILSLLSENIDSNDKISLLKLTTIEITIVDKSYSDSVNAHILKNNFSKSDLGYICLHFDEYGEGAKKEIIARAKDNMMDVISYNKACSTNLLKQLVSDTKITSYQKKQLIYNNMDNIPVDEWCDCFTVAKETKFASLFGTGRPRLEDNTLNRNILDKLVQKKIIAWYESKNGVLISHRS